MAHILLIEDDVAVVDFTRALFEKHSYTLEVAGDGEEALIAYERRRPDLILLDVFMPRLDGLHFAKELRARHPEDRVPIVVWTGAYEPEQIGDIVETPHVLSKPVASDELLEVVRRALHVDARGKSLRVLVVSSSVPTLRALVKELRQEFDVHTASRWEEALALIDMRPFEAVVVDLSAASQDGAGVLRSVSLRHKDVARVALVGEHQERLGQELEAAGAAEVVLGPERKPGTLGDRLHAILG